ncbi:hypothetical protein [uncultured Paenibacillus sp.]|uniref:hypothetical protein n=1 Tax=uncultured Paenibacillus sp. TaxID=227322 RepID=UPI0028D428D1|nr:hypothetical protein [uncultured Paenibacillus sp.]
MDDVATNRFALVCDLIAELLLPHLAKQEHSLRISEISPDVIAASEREIEAHLDHEMTAELLGTPDYRLIA